MWANLQRNIENTTFFGDKSLENTKKTCNFAAHIIKLIGGHKYGNSNKSNPYFTWRRCNPLS